MSNKLGHYDDSVGHQDTETCPAKRDGEKCLQCNDVWHRHSGWKCLRNNPRNGSVAFDECPSDDRYLTPSMSLSRHGYLVGPYKHLYDSKTGKPLTLNDVRVMEAPAVSAVTTSSFAGPDLSDWKTWARVPKGFCACGCPKHQCPTHKYD